MEDIIYELDEDDCPCSGFGWTAHGNSWKECPLHFEGQLHPESKQLLLDDLNQLHEEERKSMLRWKIDQVKKNISNIQQTLRAEQANLVKLELELINRTPTVKMPAIASSLLNPSTVMVIHEEDVHEDLVFHSIADGE
jgi:hypothetical protein